MTAIEEIGELKRLDVRPGDRFVLTSEKALSPRQVDSIRATWARCFASGQVPELLILDGGLKIGVVRMESGDPCPA